MKFKSPLFSLCINAFLLSVFVGRSNGGVANLCEQGKYFDTSKQEYRPCSECKSEIQECFSCCHSETEIQDEESNTKNVSTLTTHPQTKDFHGAKKDKPLPSDTSLGNTLVVSTISVFIVASLVVLLLIFSRGFLGRTVEVNDNTNDSQRSVVVREVMMVEVEDESNNGDTTASTNSVQSIQL